MKRIQGTQAISSSQTLQKKDEDLPAYTQNHFNTGPIMLISIFLDLQLVSTFLEILPVIMATFPFKPKPFDVAMVRISCCDGFFENLKSTSKSADLNVTAPVRVYLYNIRVSSRDSPHSKNLYLYIFHIYIYLHTYTRVYDGISR